jgi:hypothetical protein
VIVLAGHDHRLGGGATGRQAHLELIHHDRRQRLELADTPGVDRYGLAVHHAQRAEIEAVGGAQRHGDAKPPPGFTQDVGAGDGAKFGDSNVGRASVGGSNVGRPDVGLRTGWKREADRGQHGVACRSALDFGRRETMMRLEPDAVAVGEADDRDRDVEQIRGQRGDAVAGGFGRSIEDLVAHQRRKARAFVVHRHGGGGYENVETVVLGGFDQMQHGSAPQGGMPRNTGPYTRGTWDRLDRGGGGSCSLLNRLRNLQGIHGKADRLRR